MGSNPSSPGYPVVAMRVLSPTKRIRAIVMFARPVPVFVPVCRRRGCPCLRAAGVALTCCTPSATLVTSEDDEDDEDDEDERVEVQR
jgi:hypothetical protein